VPLAPLTALVWHDAHEKDPPTAPKYVLTKNVTVSAFAPPFTETVTTYCPVVSAVKLEYCLVVLSRTATEPVGLDINDHVNEVTTVAPEPVVSAIM
jgi:hypothetical protein